MSGSPTSIASSADGNDGQLKSRASPWRILGWACYLACSWTWCIGMFLPVLLIRDYGVWSFVVFAIPNVLGAAAMGWVLRRGGQSEAIVQSHKPALLAFSLVTTGFQVFFLTWLVTTGSDWHTGAAIAASGYGPVALLIIGLLPTVFIAAQSLSNRHNEVTFSLAAAAILWLISATVALYGLTGGYLRLPPAAAEPPSTSSLLALSPVMAFGFLLCPYGDLSFHRARQSLPGIAGTRAFALGFGFFFLAMIAMTLGYAHLFLRSDSPGTGLTSAGKFAPWLATHLMLQLFATTAIHCFELLGRIAKGIKGQGTTDARSTRITLPGMLMATTILIAAFGIPACLAKSDLFPPSYDNLVPRELVYRLFMSFYGLFFPAYVWLCMMPTWQSPQRPTHRQWIALLVACALAAPTFWMGFVERREWWLVPGLAVVLLARLFVGPVKPAAPAPAVP